MISYSQLERILNAGPSQTNGKQSSTPVGPIYNQPGRRDPTLAGTSVGPNVVMRCQPSSTDDTYECSLVEGESKGEESGSNIHLFEKYKNSVVQVLAESMLTSVMSP